MDELKKNTLRNNYHGLYHQQRYQIELVESSPVLSGHLFFPNVEGYYRFEMNEQGELSFYRNMNETRVKEDLSFIKDVVKNGLENLEQLKNMSDEELEFYDFALHYQDDIDSSLPKGYENLYPVSNIVKFKDGMVWDVKDIIHLSPRKVDDMRFAHKVHDAYMNNRNRAFVPLDSQGNSISVDRISHEKNSVSFLLEMDGRASFAQRFGFITQRDPLLILNAERTGDWNITFDVGRFKKDASLFLEPFEIQYLKNMSECLLEKSAFSHVNEILPVITYEELITTVACNLPKNQITPENIRKEFENLAQIYMRDARNLLSQNMDNILVECGAKEDTQLDVIKNTYLTAMENRVSETNDNLLAFLVVEKLNEMNLQERNDVHIREVIRDVAEDNWFIFEDTPFSEHEPSFLYAVVEECSRNVMSLKATGYESGLSAGQQDFFKSSPLKNGDGSLMKFYTLAERGTTSFDKGTVFFSNQANASFDNSVFPSMDEDSSKIYEVYVNGKSSEEILFENSDTFWQCFENYLEAQGEFTSRDFMPDDAKGFCDYLVAEDMGYSSILLGDNKLGYTLISLPSCEIKEVSDLTPRHDGKINSMERQPEKNRQDVEKNLSDKGKDR